MKREFLRGFTLLMLVVTFALATEGVSVNAQTTKRIVADIPFEFVVGNETMQAGEYTVTSANTAGQALLIQGTDNGMAVMRSSAPADEMKGKASARLVFHRYGQRNFLAQVWTGENSGRALTKSKQERAVERELALIHSKSELAQSTYEIIEVVAMLR
jgi:hypothetical protein